MKQETLQNLFDKQDYDGALKVLYKSSLPKIKKMSRDMGANVEDALDVFQEAVLVLIRKVKSQEFDFTHDVDAFLYTVAKRMMINKLKRDTKIRFTDEYTDNMVEHDVQKHENLKKSSVSIDEVLQHLGQKCHEILKAVFVDELNPKEIVVKLNLSSTDTLKTYKNRCKNKLTTLLNEQPHLKKLLVS